MALLRLLLALFAAQRAHAQYYFFDADLLNITWIDIEGGELIMGADEDDELRYEESMDGNNSPAHTVYVNDYSMAMTEVTNAQYLVFLNEAWNSGMLALDYVTNTSARDESGWSAVAVAGPYEGEALIIFDAVSATEDSINRGYFEFDTEKDENPFYITDGTKSEWPVVFIRWYGAAAFAYHFNLSLPTEAQWEFAARADFDYASVEQAYASDDGFLDQYKCNYNDNIGHPLPVCTFLKSRWGFCDLCGNVWEWVNDWYANSYYECSPYDNPQGPDGTDVMWEDDDFADEWTGVVYGHVAKIARGGSFNYHSETMQITYRKNEYQFHGNDHFGFRVTKYWGDYEPYTPDSCEDDDTYERAVEYWEYVPSVYNVGWFLTTLLIVGSFVMIAMSWHKLYRGNRAINFMYRKNISSGDVLDEGETRGLLMRPPV